jgi:acetyltransferase-like isoleucine patch superfamily enzyme
MIRYGIHPSAVIDVQGHCALPDTTVIEPGCVLYVGEGGSIELGERNTLYPNTTFRIDRGWMRTGAEVSFGPGCQIYEPRGGLEIGDNCLIAGGVIISGVNHSFRPSALPMREQPAEDLPVRIGNDVWIGMGAVICPGVTIGDGAVVGAGSVVTRDVPSRVVGWGAPWRLSRHRDAGHVLSRHEGGPIKLHLGCGPRYIPGYIHVDGQRHPHVDIVADLKQIDVIPDNSADLVYASHVLEHFGRWEFRSALLEWRRVLKSGGVLRLAVPDFAACARLYYEKGLEDGLSGLIGLIAGGQRDSYDFHKMIFDEPFLKRELQGLGFRDVRPWDWRSAEHAGVDDFSQAYLPHLDKENGTLMSLNLECRK